MTAFDGKAFARALGGGPGVYLMRDQSGRALYVGKARNLKRRVASYFDGRDKQGRIRLMLGKVASMEVSLTRTEAEALLLENEWIKSLKPRYNINLRDDKSYPWIRLTSDQEFPRMAFYRGGRREPGEYFGPYSSAGAVREALNQIYRLFGIRQCRDSVFKNRTRPCLQYQIERCSAPCVGYIKADEYARDVAAARDFMNGKNDPVIEHLSRRMEEASRSLDYERAAKYRDRIHAVRQIQSNQYVTGSAIETDVIVLDRQAAVAVFQVVEFRLGRNVSGRSYFPANIGAEQGDAELMAAFLGQFYSDRRPPVEILVAPAPVDRELLSEALARRREGRVRLVSRVRGARARWLELARKNASDALRRRLSERDQVGQGLEALASLLKLPAPPRRIECFDISHTRGAKTVGACVVFGPGGAERKSYRRYNIAGIQPGDDYAALGQVLDRRYRRALKDRQELPDLVLVDGGRGQAARVREVLAGYGLDALPVVGIAKGRARRAGYETWILDDREVRPGPHHAASLLVQRIRDEAHRFAIGGHRRRRLQASQSSPLEKIPGIGPRRRQALLNHFGGLTGVTAAGVEELERAPGVSRKLAETIYRHLHH